MAKPQGVIPSPEAWTEIVETVRHTRVHRPARKARRMPRMRNIGGLPIREGDLLGPIAAASHPLTGATDSSIRTYVPDPDNPGDLMIGETIVVWNRSVDMSAGMGTYVIVVRINGEWRIIWADC